MRNPSPKQRLAAKGLAEGKSIRQSMLDAGYAQSTADQGFRAVPATVLAIMPKESNLVELGRALDTEVQESLVRGRLAYGTIVGSDKGVLCAKALGSERRVNMFQPDSATGIIVLQVPPSVAVMSDDEKKKLLTAPDE